MTYRALDLHGRTHVGREDVGQAAFCVVLESVVVVVALTLLLLFLLFFGGASMSKLCSLISFSMFRQVVNVR